MTNDSVVVGCHFLYVHRVLLRLPPVVPFLPPTTVRTHAAQLTGKGGPPKGGNKYFPFSLSPSFRFQSARPALFLYHLRKSVFRPIPPSPLFCLPAEKDPGEAKGEKGGSRTYEISTE